MSKIKGYVWDPENGLQEVTFEIASAGDFLRASEAILGTDDVDTPVDEPPVDEPKEDEVTQ